MKKLVDYSDSDSETEEPLVKRKKRCQVKKDEWVCEINKKNREKGKEYCSKKKVDGEWKRNIRKPKRVMKPRCTCKEKGKSVIRCHSISEDDRKLLFAEYITICKNAKKTKSYTVEYLTYSYFKNFKNINFYNSIRPRKLKGDPKVTDIRALKYAPSGEIFYKLRFTTEYTLLNQRKNVRISKTPFENIPELYTECRNITNKKKYSDLQQLKNSMPRDYQNYYDNLPHED
ncbi:unnamed protein product [Chilo suppressalis]|uniref:Uncharacterized protein n=1 Tax=Chilo suppressalis TaxID=168631 RepID=A0ABN8B6J3_CHISP|nr:unnamed protein product [Chilo suppressalis]